jgi:hypothetical protein
VLTLLTRVEKKERQDNRQQDDLPKSKDSPIKAASLVMGIHVHDERAEADADYQPDNLSFCVPHNLELRASFLELGVPPLGGVIFGSLLPEGTPRQTTNPVALSYAHV